jgi:hypothetical protein
MERALMTQVLHQLVSALYGGAPVPAEEGGRFFRIVCDECRSRGDLFWTERRLHELARDLGYWPWSIQQIGACLAKASEHAVDREPASDPAPEEDAVRGAAAV